MASLLFIQATDSYSVLDYQRYKPAMSYSPGYLYMSCTNINETKQNNKAIMTLFKTVTVIF